MDHAVVNRQPAFDVPAHGLWIKHMLFDQHAICQGIFSIAGKYRHRCLCDDRAVIKFRSDEMHGHAVTTRSGRAV